jgi:hypothetical protein
MTINTKQKIQRIVNLVTKLNGKRKRITQDLALKLGRPPTFIEVTEELRKIQGNRRAFFPSNIIGNILADAFLLAQKKNLRLAEEKIEKAGKTFLMGLEKEAILLSKVLLISKLFNPILLIHLKKKIFSQRIEKILISCVSFQSIKNKRELSKRMTSLKKLFKS